MLVGGRHGRQCPAVSPVYPRRSGEERGTVGVARPGVRLGRVQGTRRGMDRWRRQSPVSSCAGTWICEVALTSVTFYRTQSYDKMAPVGQDPRWEAFRPLHDYLLKAFPLM